MSKEILNAKRIKIFGGSIINQNGSLVKKNLLIADQKILGFKDSNEEISDFSSELDIDASNCIISPPFVDCAARIKNLGLDHEDSLYSELRAAVAGGVTNFVCPPDTIPVLDEPGLVEMFIKRASLINKAKLHPLGALTVGLSGEMITEMAQLSESGCIGFSQSNEPIKDTNVLLKAFQYASNFNFSVWLSPMDFWLKKSGLIHEGIVSTRLGLNGILDCAESISLTTILELAKLTKVNLHICRVSSEKGVSLIRNAKSDGLKITADVAVHHLHMTELDVGEFNTNSKVIPPFRTKRDCEALSNGLMDGTIDCICSDHTPISQDEKNLPFSDATSGVIGLELLLPLTLNWAKKKNLSIQKALSFITNRPAEIIGIDKLTVEHNQKANLCIFDPNHNWTVSEDNLFSQGQNTPFFGLELSGKVRATISDGQCVFCDF